MCQVKIRAFVDQQPGDIIPVEKIGAILNPIWYAKPSSFSAKDKSDVTLVFAELEALRETFVVRDKRFADEIQVERPSRLPIPKILDLNRIVLTKLDIEARDQLPKLDLNPIIRALYEDTELSHFEYSEFVKASEASRILEKEMYFQV